VGRPAQVWDKLRAASSCSLFAEGCPQGAASCELVPPTAGANRETTPTSSSAPLRPSARTWPKGKAVVRDVNAPGTTATPWRRPAKQSIGIWRPARCWATKCSTSGILSWSESFGFWPRSFRTNTGAVRATAASRPRATFVDSGLL